MLGRGGGQGQSGPGTTFLYFFIFAPFPYEKMQLAELVPSVLAILDSLVTSRAPICGMLLLVLH